MPIYLPVWDGFVDKRRMQANAQRMRIKNELIKRDGMFCALCKSTESLQVDHIVQLSDGGTNDMSNLRFLCKTCNIKAMRLSAKNKPCLICGADATGLFYRAPFCAEHIDECKAVRDKSHRLRCYRDMIREIHVNYEMRVYGQYIDGIVYVP